MSELGTYKVLMFSDDHVFLKRGWNVLHECCVYIIYSVQLLQVPLHSLKIIICFSLVIVCVCMHMRAHLHG